MPEKWPEAFIYSESNVLPFCYWKSIEFGFNPDVSSFFAVRRTKF